MPGPVEVRGSARKREGLEAIEPGHHDVRQRDPARGAGRPQAPAVGDGLDGPVLAQETTDVVTHVGIVVGQ
jgi:hypothetical protein